MPMKRFFKLEPPGFTALGDEEEIVIVERGVAVMPVGAMPIHALLHLAVLDVAIVVVPAVKRGGLDIESRRADAHLKAEVSHDRQDHKAKRQRHAPAKRDQRNPRPPQADRQGGEHCQ